jgi:glutaminyl-peptide cyclotransferase
MFTKLIRLGPRLIQQTLINVNILFACSLLLACSKSNENLTSDVDSLALQYSVLSSLPHNPEAFTEGLVFHGNKLLESTGMNNQSWIAEVDLASGKHDKKVVLDTQYFGEGITVLNDKIYHLTYKEKEGFIYDATSYAKIGQFKYNTEGWGLTHDAKNLIMSDGTDKLYFLDTTKLNVVRTLSVTDSRIGRVKNLNELEYVNNFIFANVYESSTIVKIDPANGKVVGRLNLDALANAIKILHPGALELNGIAYDTTRQGFVVTGKYWPRSYLIKIL